MKIKSCEHRNQIYSREGLRHHRELHTTNAQKIILFLDGYF